MHVEWAAANRRSTQRMFTPRDVFNHAQRVRRPGGVFHRKLHASRRRLAQPIDGIILWTTGARPITIARARLSHSCVASANGSRFVPPRSPPHPRRADLRHRDWRSAGRRLPRGSRPGLRRRRTISGLHRCIRRRLPDQ